MSIPKKLHVIWLGSPLPQKFFDNIADWQLMNPDWRLNLWTEPMPCMHNIDLYESANAYVKPDAVWQMRADLMRYEILLNHGGFYVDVDTRPLRPIVDLFDGLSEFAVAEDQDWISNTYLASVPDHPMMEAIVHGVAEHADKYQHAAAGVVTGPQYMTPRWTGHVDQRTHLWHPYSWSDVRQYRENKVEIPEDAYAVHSWNHSLDRRRRSDRAARKAKT